MLEGFAKSIMVFFLKGVKLPTGYHSLLKDNESWKMISMFIWFIRFVEKRERGGVAELHLLAIDTKGLSEAEIGYFWS